MVSYTNITVIAYSKARVVISFLKCSQICHLIGIFKDIQNRLHGNQFSQNHVHISVFRK
jgi:hypothetical protein